MYGLTPEGLHAVEDIAARNGVGTEAAVTLLRALVQGGGTQAQFSHPDLGGMGQWSQGGMIMVGDMFNQGLKYRVDALCNELATLLRQQPQVFEQPRATQSQSQSSGNGSSGVSLFVSGNGGFGPWWPAELGSPNSTGAQNDLRYAWFQGTRRLAIQQGGRLRVYDTGNHMISGFGQQQGGDQSITFVSQFGVVRVADLPEVTAPAPAESVASEPTAETVFAPPAPVSDSYRPPIAAPAVPASSDDIFKTLERLADLHQKGIVTAEEFAAKKVELLSRL